VFVRRLRVCEADGARFPAIGIVMQLLLTVMLAALLVSSAADAADVGAPQPVKTVAVRYNWSGPYVGIQGGYGWGNSHHSTAGVPTFTDNFAVNGGLIGATAGYNVQFNNALVLGVEGDASFAALRGSTGGIPPAFCPPGPPTAVCVTKLNGLETLRVRAGYAWDRFLPYLTGGIAIGQIYGATDPGSPNSGTTSRVTWTGGAGIEAALAGRWTAKLEYLYADFGTANNLFIRNPGGFPFDVSLRTHILRVGANYRFN
jgi:outer membrane immunogenic protein